MGVLSLKPASHPVTELWSGESSNCPRRLILKGEGGVRCSKRRSCSEMMMTTRGSLRGNRSQGRGVNAHTMQRRWMHVEIWCKRLNWDRHSNWYKLFESKRRRLLLFSEQTKTWCSCSSFSLCCSKGPRDSDRKRHYISLVLSLAFPLFSPTRPLLWLLLHTQCLAHFRSHSRYCSCSLPDALRRSLLPETRSATQEDLDIF